MRYTCSRLAFAAVLLLLSVALAAGCGGSGGPTAGEGGSSGGASQAAGGSVLVLHNLDEDPPGRVQSRTLFVGPEATTFVFTGLGRGGDVLYGPHTFGRAAQHLLEGVPLGVVRLDVEYRRADGTLYARASVPVQVTQGGQVTVAAGAHAPLTIQVVNEVEDEDVYVLLSAKGDIEIDTLGGTLATYEIGKNSPTVTSTKLSAMHPATPPTRVSSLTGKTVNVYEFVPTKVVSGRLWVSYGGPLTYETGDNAPDNFAPNVRYDKMELGYDPSTGDPKGYFDLTSVDFFAIPMQLEVLLDPDQPPSRVATFYTSTSTLLDAMYHLDTGTMAQAFYKKGGPCPCPSPSASPAPCPSPSPSASPTASPTPCPGWTPGTDSMDDFIRAMSPATLASVKPQKEGDPYSAAPWPSFSAYLADLANKGTAVTFQGSNGVDGGTPTDWYYQASVSSDGNGGFLVTCRPTQTMSNTPQGSLGDANYPPAVNDTSLPKDLTVVVPLTREFVDSFVYGVPANAFEVQGLDCNLAPYSKNSVYANIAGNFLASLSFGYVDGNYGSDGAFWFETLPGFPPYGKARPMNDGYYNPYAAIIYNLSDSYSFSISDRLQTGNPLLTTLPDTPYLRISILPDDRLDAPGNVQVTPGGDGTSLQVSWDAIATPPTGFTLTGYEVIARDGSVQVVDPTSSPFPAPTPSQATATASPAPSPSATVTGLEPGTAYRVTVIAQGTYQPQTGPSASVSSTQGIEAVAATGPAPSPSPSPTATVTYQVGVTPPASVYPGTKFKIDGTEVTSTENLTVVRPQPTTAGSLVRSLFQIVGPNPAGGAEIIYTQSNVFLNLFDASATRANSFNAFFNFPFSHTVPATGTAHTTMADGSLLGLSYSGTFGSSPGVPQPPFNNAANSLVASIAVGPTNMPKTPFGVVMPGPAPSPAASPTPAPAPTYSPTPPTPSACPTFTVQVVTGPGGPTLAQLKGSTVQFQRLVTYPTYSPTTGPQVPAKEGLADGAAPLGANGTVDFDPSDSPYNAPIWNLGYQVDVIYQPSGGGAPVTYHAYGSWRTPTVGAEWKSGLAGQPDKPGVIYVPAYGLSTPTDQVLFGN